MLNNINVTQDKDINDLIFEKDGASVTCLRFIEGEGKDEKKRNERKCIDLYNLIFPNIRKKED